MQFTVASVLNIFLFGSIVAALVLLLLRKTAFLRKIGPTCGIIVLAMVVFRMLLPVEFPYTYNFYVEDILTPFRLLFEIVLIEAPVEIMVRHVLLMVWAGGVLYLLIRKVWVYRKLQSYVSLLDFQPLPEFCRENGLEAPGAEAEAVSAVVVKDAVSPYLTGWRNPRLVLPEMDYSTQQLEYIIQHELMHRKGGDIFWKVLLDLLCTCFWWNPVFFFLKREFFHLIEVRNDARLAEALSEEDQLAYMECLFDTAVKSRQKSMVLGTPFNNSRAGELKQRIRLFSDGYHLSRRLQTVFIAGAVLVLFLTTTVVVDATSTDPPPGGGTPITPENAYLIQNGSQYEVYLTEEGYLCTVDDLLGFEKLPVYESLEEAEEAQREENSR